jgi:hypothetical protein
VLSSAALVSPVRVAQDIRASPTKTTGGSRAYPAGGRRKLPQVPGNPRKPGGEKSCSCGKPPPTPAQPGTTKTGLSRRGRGFESRRSRTKSLQGHQFWCRVRECDRVLGQQRSNRDGRGAVTRRRSRRLPAESGWLARSNGSRGCCPHLTSGASSVASRVVVNSTRFRLIAPTKRRRDAIRPVHSLDRAREDAAAA